MLKQPYEDDLVGVWAQSDQGKDVCAGARAVVWGEEGWLQPLCEVVLVAWVRPKPQERLYTGIVPGWSRHDRRVLKPWQGYMGARNALICSTHDAESTNCRCTQSDTCRLRARTSDGRHGDIYA